MPDCPKCGDPVKEGRCNACGWTREKRSANDAAPHDPMHGCCEYVSYGDRCHYAGTISRDNHGKGPWHCREHHAAVDDPEIDGDAIVKRSWRDVPVPDYSIEARRAAFKQRREQAGA